MLISEKLSGLKIYNKSCYGLAEVESNSVDALVTDPPYGISFKNSYWDKDLPDVQIWEDSLRTLKPGGFGLVFSSVRLMHRLMVQLEDTGFIIRDVLFYAFLNGMPKSRDLALDIDKKQGVESTVIGKYKYVQGYKLNGADTYTKAEGKDILSPNSDLGNLYKGAGNGIKPAYEPIILIQKPLECQNIAENLIKFGTGALNINAARIPYQKGEAKVGHNPNPLGRVPSNIVRTEDFLDGYDKFFVVSKVRQNAEIYNNHPTLKPLSLMNHLVKLVSWEGQTILDPFMGSGSTGLAALNNKRNFTGYELDQDYYSIASKRFDDLQHTLF